MTRIVPNLWINDGKVEEAVDFWVGVFDGSRIVSSADYGPEAGQWAGEKMAINFELRGDPFTAINGGDTSFSPNEAVSLAVPCDTQDEIDHLWKALCDGGEPGPCGWLKDRYGFSWQVYPAELEEMMLDSDPEKVRRVIACFMAVNGRAFDIEELRAAYEGR
ncbi:MAG TPA: VOC family protein [Marmoricola sp.]|nr:VOC family protein [Marmoricola sp.]